ncbi:AAA family ATPase [Sulfitobacter sp. HNIBRBA2951]|uniref:AAA family ATPase n=1 Tax=Sulfitobacter aquimarinus TaxID=3158557 RepID=UPI0032DF0A9E
MKLREITLDNVRRFTEPVTIGPIGDGVTLLCEPNEAGKSTLFDALHAVFFLKHNSKSGDVTALRPHSGGKVSVECTLEHEGATWRIRKEWLTGASARIWRDGTLVHQAEAAEDWLANLVSGAAGGPGGLLWVRQGRVFLEASEKKDQRDEFEKRRDLLTAISGAVEQVTGGERMDRIRSEVSEALNRLQSSRGARKGGRWADAQDAVDALGTQEAELAGLVEALRSDLDARRRLTAELGTLDAPEAAQKRRADLAAAGAALKEAEGLAQELETLRTRADLAKAKADSERAEIARQNGLWDELEKATSAYAQADEAHAAAAQKSHDAQAADTAAGAALSAATAAHAEADKMLRRIDDHARAKTAKDEHTRLGKVIAQAEAADADRIAAHAIISKGPDDKTVDTIEKLARAVTTSEAVRDAAAPRVIAHYDPDAPMVTMGGTPVAAQTPTPLPADGMITLPGIGQLQIDTADQETSATIAQAQASLATALDAGGWPDMTGLRDAARIRAQAQRAHDLAQNALQTLAPDGVEHLRLLRAAIAIDETSDATDLPDRASAMAARLQTEQTLEQAQADARQTDSKRQACAIIFAQTEAKKAAAHERQQKAARDVEGLPPLNAAEGQTRLEELLRAATDAQTAAETLASKLPDVQSLKARHDRLEAVARAAAADRVRIEKQIAELNVRIEIRGQEGVEEALEDVRGRLSVAQATLARVVQEKDVLVRLLDALDTAQKAARETYFAPVAEELRPLLADLWDDAELQWSDETLLPVSLLRKGTEEPIDVLSGGTQEQIAFLVRLAFARLLAKSGRHAPLILDDALVYSDDDRIERMFDALHGAAGDLQIIVLSCRQRAFRELGAPSLGFRPATGL